MKPTVDPASEASDSPPLAVMPAPSLQAQLQASEEREAVLRSQIQAANVSISLLQEERTSLSTRVKSLEENPLIFALNHVDAGSVLEEAGDKLTELSKICLRRQDKGCLSIKLNVRPFKGNHGALIVEPEVKMTEPKEEPAQSVFYATEEGELSRQDPRQKELQFS